MYMHMCGREVFRFFFSFCVVVTTGQSLARCQQGPASNLEVEHNR